MATMYPTRNDLPADVRSREVDLLNTLLAHAVDLVQQAKQAHWNVRGPDFKSLHELFDGVYAMASGHMDTLAERAVQLGGIAEGTVQKAVERSALAVYPMEKMTQQRHLGLIADSIAAFGIEIRKAIAVAADLGDADTSDLFTEISRDLDEKLWMVEAHLEQ